MAQFSKSNGPTNTDRGRRFSSTIPTRVSAGGASFRALVLFWPLVMLAAPATQAAPKVEWVRGSPDQLPNFFISTSRAHSPHSFEIRGGFKTRAEAEAEVKRLINIDKVDNSSWRFAIIRIEEKPAKPLREGIDELERQLRELHKLYLRVKNQRDTLLKYRGSKFLDETAASEANLAIDYYNSQWRATYAILGKDYNERLSKYGLGPFGELHRISPDGLIIDAKNSIPSQSSAPESPAPTFKVYTRVRHPEPWVSAGTHGSLEAAKAAGETYLFAAEDQRCFAVVDMRQTTKVLGDQITYADVYNNALVQRCKPWGAKAKWKNAPELNSRTARSNPGN